MRLGEADWMRRDSLHTLVALLGGDGETRAVGGSVRDTLLGLPVSDLDLATRLLPEAVMARLRAGGLKVVPTGLAHGTVTALTVDGPVEVTTLRRDVETDGRHARVDFTDDWRADAARRDFTINALYASVGDGAVHDYFEGLADLGQRRVRFIGEPLQRIAEDHLRILRFFRFHARFGRGAPDAAGLAACRARANDLMALSRERIASELLKLLALDDPAPTVAIMVDTGILRPVLPEFDAAAVERLRALVDVERRAGARGAPERRLAALLGPGGVRDVPARLRLSNAQAKRVEAASTPSDEPARVLLYRRGREGALDRLLLDGRIEELPDLDARVPVLPIKGADLVARGLSAGPAVGAALRAIETAWIDAGFVDGATFDALVADVLSRGR